MKQIVLAAMVMMTMAGTAQAETNGWDYFWGTTVSQALDPKINGWDDFWGQCQDPTKTTENCVGVVAAGIGLALVIPVVAVVGGAVVISAVPAAGTVVGPLSAVEAAGWLAST